MVATTTAIINIGKLVSGMLSQPLLEADAILVSQGKIEAIGSAGDPVFAAAECTMDVQGCTVTPGFIDCHAHPLFGEWAPRLDVSGYIEWAIQGGVTSMISAGEVHLPGRPRDPAGVKALAILAHKSFSLARPSHVKVHAGAVILEPGLTDADFREMANEGVWLVGEIGLGGITDPDQAGQMAGWAKACGMKVMMHAGGLHSPPSAATTARDIRTVRPDVISHINGGTTAMAETEIEEIVRETDFVMDLVLSGNPKVRSTVLRWMRDQDQLHRLMLGVDAPGGTGIPTIGMLRHVMEVTAIDGVPPAVSIALATGNTADVYALPTGKIELGREADLVVLDAPLGSPADDALSALERGDTPGIAAVMVDGEVRVQRSRLTPPPKRLPTVTLA